MGILDDAIRQHLELKRSHGTDESELQRLEDEAFGPPSRPGEPDFPGEEPEAQEGGVAVADEQRPPEPEAGPGGEPATELEAPAPDTGEAAELFEAPAFEAEEQPLPAVAVEEAVEEEEALEDESAEFFDQEETDLELDDLDLELDDELEAVEAEEEVVDEGETSAPVAEPPVESLDTVEHDVEEERREDEPSEPATGDEDVLEETPEFLRDAPEDDELWFEQGEPKDFDF